MDIMNAGNLSMKIGDVLKLKYDSFSQDVFVVSTDYKTFGDYGYNVYYLYKEKGYVLYEKKGYAVDNPLDVKGHLILSEEEIKGGDYYLKIELDNYSKGKRNGDMSLECLYSQSLHIQNQFG